MKGALLAALIVVTMMLGPPPGFAQTADELKALRKDVEALKEGQTAIQKQLQDIKGLLQARPTAGAPAAAPQEAVLNLDGAPVKGDKNAKVTLVDFTDYQ